MEAYSSGCYGNRYTWLKRGLLRKQIHPVEKVFHPGFIILAAARKTFSRPFCDLSVVIGGCFFITSVEAYSSVGGLRPILA